MSLFYPDGSEHTSERTLGFSSALPAVVAMAPACCCTAALTPSLAQPMHRYSVILLEIAPVG